MEDMQERLGRRKRFLVMSMGSRLQVVIVSRKV